MYIALEGIKGTGKSSIIPRVEEHFTQRGEKLSLFPITRELPPCHHLERLHGYRPQLKERDDFVEQLFARRAAWQQRQVKSRCRVLGDRSLVTAYVTRWTKWNDPFYTIKRAHRFHQGIALPDVIIWLKTSTEQAYKNIRKRAPKNMGRAEECAEKLLAAAEAYEELFTEKLYHRKIRHADIITVPACYPLKETTGEILNILKHYYKL